MQIGENHDEEQKQEHSDLGEGFNGGKDKGKKPHIRRRGQNPFLESTSQSPTKRKRALAPNIDQEQSPYYRNNFQSRRTNTPTPVTADAHAGLRNCDVICYSNAIFQGIASCMHVSDFLQTPPNEEHQHPQEGMFFDSQWMNQLTMYIPLTNYSSCQTSEDAHEYIMGLKQCLLDELTQSEDGSGVTNSDSDYDENLYMRLKTFWGLFSAGQFTHTVTCTACGNVSRTDEPFSELMLTFPQPHHERDQDCTVEDLIAHHCGMQDIDGYQCDCCNGRKLAKKVTAITTCPPHLVHCTLLQETKWWKYYIVCSVSC